MAHEGGTTGRRPLLPCALVLVAAACGAAGAESAPGVDVGTSPIATTTIAPPTTRPATTTTRPGTTTTTTTTTSTTTTTTTTTTTPPPPTTVEPLPNPALPATTLAFVRLAADNAAASVTVVRDGVTVFSEAAGRTIDGGPADADTPMVVASVSKVITAVAVARLHAAGMIDPAAPMPWSDIGIDPHPAWHDVTVRELLDHRSGMPVVRTSWFQTPGDCAGHLPGLLDAPPGGHRGRWRYSNGNYCALGLLVERVTGEPLDVAAQRLVFSSIDAEGVHLTVDGQRPGDVEYRLGVERLSRLGGAGVFVASTDDLAMMAATLTPDDLAVLTWPGMFADQYGWGHTGTVDGAKSCLWVLEGGRTAIVATVAGERPSTGGGVCDIVVPAIAGDLGLAAGPPDRSPP